MPMRASEDLVKNPLQEGISGVPAARNRSGVVFDRQIHAGVVQP
jgi:hypothetical protein